MNQHSHHEQIPIASDHAGVELKSNVISKLSDFEWEDLGPSTSDRVDYPDYALKVAELVSLGYRKRGILICGSGIGMCIAANKYKGVRVAVVESVEAARLSREHNDANILCMGARLLTEEKAMTIVRAWLSTPFTKEGRHQARIDKIHDVEK